MKSIIIILLFITTTVLSQDKLQEYRQICYCNTQQGSPATIIQLDNNWEVFNTIPNSGIKKDSLLKNFEINESQLRLLKDWRILKENNGIVFKNIILLDSTLTESITKESKGVAVKVLGSMSSALKEYINVVENRYQGQGFTLLFTYVIDGLVWKEFESRKLIESRKVTDNFPLWNGEYWFIKNKRSLDFGTNSHTIGNFNLSVMWNDLSLQHINELYNKGILFSLSTFINKTPGYNQDSIKRILKDYGILKTDGELAIPLINSIQPDEIFIKSNNLSKLLVSEFLKNIRPEELIKTYGFKSASQALIIFYHEFMWDLLEELVRSEIIKIPTYYLTGNLISKEQLKTSLILHQEKK
jgi:hypothetical protein